jgi:hypothetical protein
MIIVKKEDNIMHKSYLARIFAIATLLMSSVTWAGPVFLTGHDPDFHAQGEAGAQRLLTSGLAFVTGGTYVAGNTFAGASTLGSGKFLWVESNIGIPGGHRRGENGLISIGLTAGTDYDSVNAAGFTALADFSAYSAIGIASSFGGLLTRAELDALILRSGDIGDFINFGGGLFASSECFPCGANLLAGSDAPDLFGYLPIDVTSIGANAPFTVTAAGAAAPFSLTNADLNSPTHNSFGLTGGLTIIDTDSQGNATTLAGDVLIDDGGFVPVPEPGTLGLFLAGLFGLALRRKKAA